jgi:hypothetical protein
MITALRLRPRIRAPRAVAAVVADRHDDRPRRVVGAHRDLPPQRPLERRLEAAQALGSGVAQADVAVLLRLERLRPAALDVGQPELLAHDLRQLLERDLDLERLVALALAGLAGAALAVLLLPADRVSGVALALSDALPAVVAEHEARDVDLRHRDRHRALSLRRDEVAARDVFAQVLPNFPANDLAEATVILFDARNHGGRCNDRRGRSVCREGSCSESYYLRRERARVAGARGLV